MMVGKVLNGIKAEIKSEPGDASFGEITAQEDVAGGEEIKEPSDDDSSAQGSLEKCELNSQTILGKIKEESIDIKSDPEDEPVVGITPQDVAGVEEFKEATDNVSRKAQRKPKIKADDQSDASGVYALHGNESLVTRFKSRKSQSESESVQSKPGWSTLYKTPNGTRLTEKDRSHIIKPPLSRVSPSEYTILESKRVQCNYCPNNTQHVYGTQRHIRQRHRGTTNFYKCCLCPHTSKYYRSALEHIISKHKSDNKLLYFECYTCGRRFKFKAILIRHMNIHRTEKELMKTNEMHKCQECDRLFRSRGGLDRHIENCHTQKMQCCHCSFRCRDRRSLISHIQKYHTPLERLQTLKCPKCNFTTKFYADLRKHKASRHSQSSTWGNISQATRQWIDALFASPNLPPSLLRPVFLAFPSSEFWSSLVPAVDPIAMR